MAVFKTQSEPIWSSRKNVRLWEALPKRPLQQGIQPRPFVTAPSATDALVDRHDRPAQPSCGLSWSGCSWSLTGLAAPVETRTYRDFRRVARIGSLSSNVALPDCGSVAVPITHRQGDQHGNRKRNRARIADLRVRRMQGLRDAGVVVARPVQWRLHG